METPKPRLYTSGRYARRAASPGPQEARAGGRARSKEARAGAAADGVGNAPDAKKDAAALKALAKKLAKMKK